MPFFLSCYTTFWEVFNILDLLGYTERGVRRAGFRYSKFQPMLRQAAVLACLRDYYTSAEVLYAVPNA